METGFCENFPLNFEVQGHLWLIRPAIFWFLTLLGSVNETSGKRIQT